MIKNYAAKLVKSHTIFPGTPQFPQCGASKDRLYMVGAEDAYSFQEFWTFNLGISFGHFKFQFWYVGVAKWELFQ